MAMNFLGTTITGSTNEIYYGSTLVDKVVWKDRNNVETVVYKTPDFNVKVCVSRCVDGLWYPYKICDIDPGQWVCLGDGLGSACANSATNPSSLKYRTDGHTSITYPLNIEATNKGDENYYLRIYNGSSGIVFGGAYVSASIVNGTQISTGYGNYISCSIESGAGDTITIPPGTTCTTIPISIPVKDMSASVENLSGNIKILLRFDGSRNMCVYSDSCSCLADCPLSFGCNYNLLVGDYV